MLKEKNMHLVNVLIKNEKVSRIISSSNFIVMN